MTVTGSIGLLAPAGTPTGIIERIAQATRKAVAEPAHKQMLIDAGMEATLSTQTPKNSDIPSQPMLLSGRQSSRRSG
jgi:tripartite-type tricarboxylate transporter receptor subunit TctC